MSFTKVIYHIVIRTKHSELTINQQYANDLYAYMQGIVKKHKCRLYQINGIEDHIHILLDLHPSVALANFVQSLKRSSSLWLQNQYEKFPHFRCWSEGYAAFTYSYSDRHTLINYIKNQQEHHAHESTKDELMRILETNGYQKEEK